MAHHIACCSLPPVVSNYQSSGQHITLPSGLDAYATGSDKAHHVIVIIYDIFGYWPTTFQVADLLAQGLGARVIMPDFFKGKPWPLSNFPPKNPSELTHWITTQGDYNTVIKPHLHEVITHVVQPGVTHVGIVGMCWGAKMATLSVSDDLATTFQAAALLHPAFLDVEHVKYAKRPLCVLPSKDEPDMRAHQEAALSASKLAVFQRFDDMHHGWCGARADFNDELNRKRTYEAVTIVIDFFKKVFA